MALIKCPECGQSVSDKASKCPKCGYPIQEYLNKEKEDKPEETAAVSENGDNDSNSKQTESSENMRQDSEKKQNSKKIIAAAAAVCVIIAAVMIISSGLGLSPISVNVSDISIGKWRLTDSSDYFDYYEGTITSEQKKPFIAVIGSYEDEDMTPELVYTEDGTGIMETSENTDDDPSKEYRPIGYMSGKQIDISDIETEYTDSDYDDYSYSEYTSCDVKINISMKDSESGILVFDVDNETNNETDRNLTVVVVDGKAEYNYSADLPYKSRGIDISVVPKLFCRSSDVKTEDYAVKKVYTAEKDEGVYYSSYKGEEVLSFGDYDDGFIIYTSELKEGGNKEDRYVVKNNRAFLHDGECTFETYDFFEEDTRVLKPFYEFNIVGYVTWMPLETEVI